MKMSEGTGHVVSSLGVDCDDDDDDKVLSFNYLNSDVKQQTAGPVAKSTSPASVLTNSDSKKRKNKHCEQHSAIKAPQRKVPKQKGNLLCAAEKKGWNIFCKNGRAANWTRESDDGLPLDPDTDRMLRPRDALIMKKLEHNQLVWAILSHGQTQVFWPARTHQSVECIAPKQLTKLIKDGGLKHQADFTNVTYLYSGSFWLVARVKNEDIHPIIEPGTAGGDWEAKSNMTRGTIKSQRKAKKGYLLSFPGDLEGAMGLALKYYIKLKRAADDEAILLAMQPTEEAKEDSDEIIEEDDEDIYNRNTLKPETMRAGDKITYSDITMPHHLRNQTDTVIKVFGGEERYLISLERRFLLESDSMVQRVYCGSTKSKLVKEDGLYCWRELSTFNFEKGEVEGEEAVFIQKLHKEAEAEAKADPTFASLMLNTSRRKQ